jgi:muramoyltetrapeptide carboxypeptidase LdcA involved in peptidoglycan recycling
LPYIDFDTIRKHPKIFLGFSDTTIMHFCCLKAGIESFYGSALLTGIAENGGINLYFTESVNRTLLSDGVIGRIHPNTNGWTYELLDWAEPANQLKKDPGKICGLEGYSGQYQSTGQIHRRLYGGAGIYRRHMLVA